MKPPVRLCLSLLVLWPITAHAQDPKNAAPPNAAPPNAAPPNAAPPNAAPPNAAPPNAAPPNAAPPNAAPPNAAPPNAAPPNAADVENTDVTITNAPDGTMTYDDEQKVGRITKDVVITQKGQNLIVYAQEALYSDTRNQATATGKLRVETRDSTIVGQKLYADFNARQFTISGEVVITAHGKNDGAMGGLREETNKKPVKVLCDQVVWDYDTKQATATGNIRIYQGTNEGTCNKIIYDEGQNIVKLLGNVQLGDDKSRDFRAQEIDIYIDNNVSYTPHGILRFPEKQWMNSEKEPAKSKTTTTFKPMPVIPPDVIAGPDSKAGATTPTPSTTKPAKPATKPAR